MVSSRDEILDNVKINQPVSTQLPDLSRFEKSNEDQLTSFAAVLTAIGGIVQYVRSPEQIKEIIKNKYTGRTKIITFLPQLADINIESYQKNTDPVDFADVDLAIINAHFAVAENGAVWITENLTGARVLPFICQHLAVVLNEADIVATMHSAYQLINKQDYHYGAFIAGPSKTADIEQSLVLGAHGPRSMTVYVLLKHVIE